MTDLRLSPYVPKGSIARGLWAEGVFQRELLEYAESLGVTSVEDAIAECERLDLLLPLAFRSGVTSETLAAVCVSWWLDATDRLGNLGWYREHDMLATSLIGASCEPDPSVGALRELVGKVTTLAGQRGQGAHRYRLLTAAAAIGNVRLQAFAVRPRPCADLELAVTHILGALRDAAQMAAGDLFAPRVDVDDFLDRAFAIRTDLRPASANGE